MGATRRRFKPMVRIFKNMRTYLVDHNIISKDIASSYFIECLIYNVPDDLFLSNYEQTFVNIVTWAQEALLISQYRTKQNYEDIKCQNEQQYLFGSSKEQWNVDKAAKYIAALMILYRNGV